jgi:hypothetical protein
VVGGLHRCFLRQESGTRRRYLMRSPRI